MTEFLGTWQGVIIALIVCAAIVSIILILLKNADAVKGLRISKDGVRFDTVNLTSEIPRIDKQLNLNLVGLIASLYDVFRASLTLDDSICGCADTCVTKNCENPLNRKMLKMLLVKMMIIPLINSVERNHLVKGLSKSGLSDWLNKIMSEIDSHYKIIEDYCGFDLPDEAVLTQSREAILLHFVPRARAFVKDAIHAKLSVYQKLDDKDTRKSKLESKCQQYLENLE
jgi:hypothetical protein